MRRRGLIVGALCVLLCGLAIGLGATITAEAEAQEGGAFDLTVLPQLEEQYRTEHVIVYCDWPSTARVFVAIQSAEPTIGLDDDGDPPAPKAYGVAVLPGGCL